MADEVRSPSDRKQGSLQKTQSAAQPEPFHLGELWETIVRMGLGEVAIRAGTVLASTVLALLVLWVMSSFYISGLQPYPAVGSVQAATLPTQTPTPAVPAFEPFVNAPAPMGVTRYAQMHTERPNKPRFTIEQYTVQSGDTIIGIAAKFNLEPQTILWGNFATLADDPHRLQIGQILNILPMNGVLHTWSEGEGLNKVSEYYKVAPEDIIDWPGNKLSEETVGDYAHPNIAAGTDLFVPGGTRPFTSWSAPLMSRSDPASSKIFGPGYCGSISDGYIGSGTFVWPSVEHRLSGYDYTPSTNHWGIDIAGQSGNAIYAADSGVIVYAGWNDWGYGNVLVIDHGNGWQTLYAHLSELYVGCGNSVSQGAQIAAMGSTGRSSGPHLHFEIMNESRVRVNPWDFLPK